ncbi:MAG: iron ABC transporter ATP-binding protein [Bacteroidetes bacterium HGW-Bacteroidetes-1]|jgi:iron complex transport system ATP-binding protein|nr:MAG: iron ABC transporter ATP-binding protein [Bacteroidetes bacterium HGW-Bacteroidetes-1]
MKQPFIELRDIEIGYRGSGGLPKVLLPPISLQLNEGEFVAIVGPNGTGKSTLLRTMSALLLPVRGEILFMGKKLQNYSLHERALMLSIVLTDHPDDLFLKLEDVVATGRYPYLDFWARLTKNDTEIIEQSIQLCGIDHLKGRTLVSLSDGERQKVMIAKALAQDTPLIILDEPAAFLDYPSKIELMQLLHRLVNTRNKTVLFSSHDLDLVLRSADKMWMISHGKPLVEGVPEQLVLDGTLNEYLDKDDLHFDAALGQFKMTSVIGKLVHVEGHSLHAKWLKNALLRKGFQLSEEIRAEFIITFAEDVFTVEHNQSKLKYKSIETLLYDIQKIK